MKWFRTGLMVMAAAWATCANADNRCRYRVYLTDKTATEYKLSAPGEYLSERAVERRLKQNLRVDSTDLPVCRSYVRMLENAGGKCVMTSRWNNTVLVETSDSGLVAGLESLPFVRRIEKVWVNVDNGVEKKRNRKSLVTNVLKKEKNYYGEAYSQTAMHKGDSLHLMGFAGDGMQIAVIDAGFYNADVMKALKKIKLLGTRDFVEPDADMFAKHSHGMKVLSCMAANVPHVMVGTAPEASYLLLRSEDSLTEQPSEEDAWATAVEYADSMGVDIVNTSLGYYQFDAPHAGYRYENLDGKTSLMARTASLMAQKGMLLVCSAGNTGDGSWKKITVPGDATDVLTVGAVDRDSVNTVFSAVGNTADGRVKPDIMAMGLESAVMGEDGCVTSANGTSFSAPVFCGLAACLWQACPWLDVYELMDVIRKSGNNSSSPNNIFGYGIVDMMEAYRLGMKLKR